MKLKSLMISIALSAVTTGAIAAEPTRGFSFEHGKTAESGTASIDFTNNVAGARMGVAGHELIVNSSSVGSGTNSDAVFKFAIGDISGLAVYAGLAYYDNDSSDYLNFKVGMAYSAAVGDGIELAVAPEFVVDDVLSDEYFNVGLGAYFAVADTSAGKFKLGAEVLVTSLDDVDPVVQLGVRWGFNDRINVDLVPLQFGDTDTFGVPGQVRINALF